MVYEYRLKVKDVHMTGLRGILTLRGTPVKEIKGESVLSILETREARDE